MDLEFSVLLDKIEQHIQSALPAELSSLWKEHSFGKLPPAVTDSHIEPLVCPTRELIELGGKRWRPMLLVLTAQAFDSNPEVTEKALHLTPLVEFVHTASLIHDDIEDSSDTRRGKPAAYITHGLDTALNAASWLYFEAPVCIDTLDVPVEQKELLYALYTRELRKLHLGQAMDIKWHRTPELIPSPDEYIAMVKNKTGTLASLAAKTGALCAGADAANAEKAGTIAAQIGAGFQIIDDVINLSTGNPGKKRGDDIVEGKKSLPVLLFMEKHGKQSREAQQLQNFFIQAKSEGIQSPAVEGAISLLEKSGAIEQARQKGMTLITDSCMELSAIFGNENEAAKTISNLFRSMIPGLQPAAL